LSEVSDIVKKWKEETEKRNAATDEKIKKYLEDSGMTEKGVKELQRELKAAEMRQRAEQREAVTKNRDYSMYGGPEPGQERNTPPGARDIPDVITLPKRKPLKKENIPW
tara:strand:+ start:246 stop:572 length:327 start_codon:yes stop_codon:yes gene_type:complete